MLLLPYSHTQMLLLPNSLTEVILLSYSLTFLLGSTASSPGVGDGGALRFPVGKGTLAAKVPPPSALLPVDITCKINNTTRAETLQTSFK